MGLVEPGKDASRLGQEHDPGSGRRDSRSARLRSRQEPLSDYSFEHGNLVANRRLGVAEPSRRAVERPFGGDGFERREMADLDPVPVRADSSAGAAVAQRGSSTQLHRLSTVRVGRSARFQIRAHSETGRASNRRLRGSAHRLHQCERADQPGARARLLQQPGSVVGRTRQLARDETGSFEQVRNLRHIG